jgi:hypothetical protein
VLLLQVLVKVLRRPTLVMAPVLVEHPGDLVHRHPLGRSLAQTPIHQPVKAVFLVTLAIAPELPLRAPQKLARLHRR